MEHMGWDNVIQPIVVSSNDKYASARSSPWISQQVQDEFHRAADKSGFNSPMWTNRNHPSFATLDDIIDQTTNNGNNEVDMIFFGSGISATCNAFSQQQQNLSSSGSSQVSDYVLSTDTPLVNMYFAEDHFSANETTNTSINAKTLPAEGNMISSNDNIIQMPSSRKRKSLPAAAANEMINFNGVSKKRKMSDQIELKFGSNINENSLDYSSSSGEGGSGTGGFSLIASSLPKSSNINFKLQEISSETDAPDSETIAEMKEMIYRAAAFRPVNLALDEVVEKPKRKNVKISSDPQTAAARQRRERISDRLRVLQRIVPGGNKMDTATMLDEAANYLKFLRSQVKALEKCVPTGSFGFSSYNFLPFLAEN